MKRIVIEVTSPRSAEVKFEGERLPKRELLMVQRALKQEHRRKVREYRKIVIQKAKVYDEQRSREQTDGNEAKSGVRADAKASVGVTGTAAANEQLATGDKGREHKADGTT